MTDSLLLQFDGRNMCAVYDYENDPRLTQNILGTVNIEDEEKFLRAYIQQYIYRLTTNQLTVDN